MSMLLPPDKDCLLMLEVLLGEEDRPVLAEIASVFRKSRKIVFVTGAGVSCSAGIPDFRSSDGLYNLVKSSKKISVQGKDLFDVGLFQRQETTSLFFMFMAELRAAINKAKPTPTHFLIKLARDRGRLLRCYTQNIDGLEAQTGLQTCCSQLNKREVVQLHGDIHSLKCLTCQKECDWTNERTFDLSRGLGPACPACEDASVLRAAAGKRQRAVGMLRPNIVLYGEEHPQGDVIGACTLRDCKAKPDLLIILGTSLKVQGIKSLVKDLAKVVKSNGGMVIFVNKTAVSQSAWGPVIDYHVKSDSDDWVRELKVLVPDLFKVQTRIPAKRRGEPLRSKRMGSDPRSVSGETEPAQEESTKPALKTEAEPEPEPKTEAAPKTQAEPTEPKTDPKTEIPVLLWKRPEHSHTNHTNHQCGQPSRPIGLTRKVPPRSVTTPPQKPFTLSVTTTLGNLRVDSLPP